MKIGIVGNGVVGSATARCFIEHVDEVYVYDQDKRKSTHSLEDVLKADLTFICLPSPQEEGIFECNTSYIESFFDEYYKSNSCLHNFVLRSTVPIGFTQQLRETYDLENLVHSPEFLTARCSFTDAQIPSRNIVGGDNECALKLYDLYYHRFPSVPILKMTSDESEAVKLVLNSFFATKVAFFNEANSLCSKLGLDWEKVIGGILSDGRVAHSHTKVPGPDGKFGYGGSCLPKDIANLIDCMQRNNVPHLVSLAALTRNTLDRGRQS